MLYSGVIPANMTRRSDEISPATVLVSRFDRAQMLDGRYVYLVYRRAALLRPFDRAELEELVHLSLSLLVQYSRVSLSVAAASQVR
jgi:hypothetical protein